MRLHSLVLSSILISLVALIGTTGTNAVAVENYLDRPAIEALDSRKASASVRPPGWDKAKAAALRFLAELSAFYPEDKLVFLARDGELLYDAARILNENEPGLLPNIQLLNVSRKNREDPLLPAYLKQEGLDEKGIGLKRAILVDTGFEGSIWTRILQKSPVQIRDKILCHLISSSNVDLPSSRVYLEQISKKKVEDLDELFDSVREYENLPRFTNSSDGFGERGGRIVPLSSQDQDPAVKKAAVALMADLRDSFSSKAAKEEFNTVRSLMVAFLEESRAPAPDPTKLSGILKTLSEHQIDFFGSDVVDAAAKGYLPLAVDQIRGVQAAIRLQPKYARVASVTAAESFAERYVQKEGPKRLGELTPNDQEVLRALADPDFYDEYTPVQHSRMVGLLERQPALRPIAVEASEKPSDLRARWRRELKFAGSDEELARVLVDDPAWRKRIGLGRLYDVFEDSKMNDASLLNVFARKELATDPEFNGVLLEMYEDGFEGESRQRFLKFMGEVRSLPSDFDQVLERDGVVRVAGKKNELAGRSFQKGETVKTPGGRNLKVMDYAGAGARGAVYKVKDKEGKIFALKIALDEDWDTIDSFRREVVKYEALAKVDAPRAKILEAGRDYALKEWVQGESGADWVHQWKGTGADSQAKQVKALRKLFESLAEKGVYVGDLKSDNLIWNGKRWIIVDPGEVFVGIQEKAALRLYDLKAREEWTRSLYKSCNSLFSRLHE